MPIGMTMRNDKYIADSQGNALASYGPRIDVGGAVEECEPEVAGCWGVYAYEPDGYAVCIGDALDEQSAATFARNVALLAGIRNLLEAK